MRRRSGGSSRAEAWDHRELRAADHSTTQLYLHAASEHVGGLAALYTVEEVLLSPLVLARAAIENAAHTICILGEEHKTRSDYCKRIKYDAQATFDEPHQDEHGRRLLHGHQLPAPEQIVIEMSRLASQPLSDKLMQGHLRIALELRASDVLR
jgi:hypothetical protein